MAETEFLRCPKCQCSVWNDVPNVKDPDRFHWICSRCSYMVAFGACKGCGRKAWKVSSGAERGMGGRKPWYRVTCGHCGRTIGVLLDAERVKDNGIAP